MNQQPESLWKKIINCFHQKSKKIAVNKKKIIVGLGNPGKNYESTRHNAGFLCVEMIAQNHMAEKFTLEKKFKSLVTEYTDAIGQKTILVKPQTFMNGSGEAVKAIIDFYKSDITTDVVIIHDDLDLPLGHYKKSHNRGPAGHNGVRDIIEKCKTRNFKRLRIGIDKRTQIQKQNMSGSDYVLGKFTQSEKELLKKTLQEITLN